MHLSFFGRRKEGLMKGFGIKKRKKLGSGVGESVFDVQKGDVDDVSSEEEEGEWRERRAYVTVVGDEEEEEKGGEEEEKGREKEKGKKNGGGGTEETDIGEGLEVKRPVSQIALLVERKKA